VISLDAGSSGTATLYPEPLRGGWRRGFAATKSEAQLLSTVRIFSRPIRSGFAKVEKTAQPRVAVILETKGRNLRFAEMLPPRPEPNSKKMNSLVTLRIFSAFGRPLALLLVDACARWVEKMKPGSTSAAGLWLLDSQTKFAIWIFRG